jgi:hypothetical protein
MIEIAKMFIFPCKQAVLFQIGPSFYRIISDCGGTLQLYRSITPPPSYVCPLKAIPWALSSIQTWASQEMWGQVNDQDFPIISFCQKPPDTQLSESTVQRESRTGLGSGRDMPTFTFRNEKLNS